jgi:hypothetical protein
MRILTGGECFRCRSTGRGSLGARSRPAHRAGRLYHRWGCVAGSLERQSEKYPNLIRSHVAADLAEGRRRRLRAELRAAARIEPVHGLDRADRAGLEQIPP